MKISVFGSSLFQQVPAPRHQRGCFSGAIRADRESVFPSRRSPPSPDVFAMRFLELVAGEDARACRRRKTTSPPALPPAPSWGPAFQRASRVRSCLDDDRRSCAYVFADPRSRALREPAAPGALLWSGIANLRGPPPIPSRRTFCSALQQKTPAPPPFRATTNEVGQA